ncbi:hypothetical protein B9Z55_000647 [Caenorhabditis nigoni]|uniref:Uncharacterized protein n=2 Tax=Caenorhabditis nigoni TaxID=1611254 RepID=A0A2G5VU59_9PELO|nr:hypothetical protein B9Z55_000647 [Caenorhabditis nigoni]
MSEMSEERKFKEVPADFKVDTSRMPLVLKAYRMKNFKVDPQLLKKLDNGESIDDVTNPPSTSSATATAEIITEPPPLKRKALEGGFSRKMKLRVVPDEKCTQCGCRMLRSVDPGRPDGECLLECMRASCLASVDFTSLPAGTVIGNERDAKLPLYYNLDLYYQTAPEPTPPTRKPMSLTSRGLFVEVPGQETMARFLN